MHVPHLQKHPFLREFIFSISKSRHEERQDAIVTGDVIVIVVIIENIYCYYYKKINASASSSQHPVIREFIFSIRRRKHEER